MLTRRQLLATTGQGFGVLAFSSLEAAETSHRSQVLAPKAKRVVQLFMGGAASHIDLFDYKPALIKHHGEESNFGEAVEAFQNGLGPWKKPVWEFKPYGQSGKRLSEVVAPLGACVDDMAFVHNMVGKTGVHSQGTLLQATGFNLCGGGIQGGVIAGESDQWGYKPLDRANPTTCYDIHATMMHLLGIDHEKLTVRHNGIDRRLTDVHGHVIRDLVG